MPLASIGSIAIGVAVFLVVASFVVNSLNKSAQRARGRNRCAACKSKLKYVGAQYATTCARCGTKQPWA